MVAILTIITFYVFSPAQIVKVAIALAVYCTYGLQFFVCLEIVWNPLKEKCQKRPLLCNYVLRTVLVTASVVLAILVPTIAPFMGLIGAFCFSILGLIMPVSIFVWVFCQNGPNELLKFQVFIEMVTNWESGFGAYNWIVWKNILIVLFGLFALVFGSLSAIKDIVNELGGGSEAQQ